MGKGRFKKRDFLSWTSVIANGSTSFTVAKEIFHYLWKNCESPVGHHRILMDKCKGDTRMAIFVRETLANGWSRARLEDAKETGKTMASSIISVSGSQLFGVDVAEFILVV